MIDQSRFGECGRGALGSHGGTGGPGPSVSEKPTVDAAFTLPKVIWLMTRRMHATVPGSGLSTSASIAVASGSFDVAHDSQTRDTAPLALTTSLSDSRR